MHADLTVRVVVFGTFSRIAYLMRGCQLAHTLFWYCRSPFYRIGTLEIRTLISRSRLTFHSLPNNQRDRHQIIRVLFDFFIMFREPEFIFHNLPSFLFLSQLGGEMWIYDWTLPDIYSIHYFKKKKQIMQICIFCFLHIFPFAIFNFFIFRYHNYP